MGRMLHCEEFARFSKKGLFRVPAVCCSRNAGAVQHRVKKDSGAVVEVAWGLG